MGCVLPQDSRREISDISVPPPKMALVFCLNPGFARGKFDALSGSGTADPQGRAI